LRQERENKLDRQSEGILSFRQHIRASTARAATLKPFSRIIQYLAGEMIYQCQCAAPLVCRLIGCFCFILMHTLAANEKLREKICCH
jgi:hypothetical protein